MSALQLVPAGRLFQLRRRKTDYSSCDLLNSSIKPDVIIPAGKATTAIPRKDEIIVIIFPIVVTAYTSP